LRGRRRWTPYVALPMLAALLVLGGGKAAAKSAPPTVMHIYNGAGASLPASLQAIHAGDGLAADSAGNVYVGYEGNNFFAYVAVFDSKGRFVRNWQVDSRLAGIRIPKIAVGGPDGLVYVAPRADPETIKVYRADGSFVRQFGAGSKIGPGVGDIEVDANGNVYVSSAAVTGRPDRFVVRFDPAGNVTRTWVPQPGGRSNVGGGVAVAADGSIYEVGLPAAGGHSTLTHLASDGRVLSAKDLDKTLGTGEYKDVDSANGHLYLSGHFSTAAGVSHHHALAVLGADETVQDQILGEGNQVAVSGTHVWVTELVTSPTNSRKAAASEFSIGGMDEVPIENNDKVGKWISIPDEDTCNGPAVGKEYGNVPTLIVSPGPKCFVQFVNEGTPCNRPGTTGTAVAVYVGGKLTETETDLEAHTFGEGRGGVVQLEGDQIQTGPVIMSWSCRDAAGVEVEHHYEWKGDIYRLGDPSGAVYDARTGKTLGAAIVRIEYSSTAGGPLGTPPPLTTLPLTDRETTGADGRFRWDVADGYWRLVVSAIGYHSLASKIYKVPPEVTGIRLMLRPDPAQQRYLFDPAGRVGKLKIGMRASARLHMAGLRIRVVHGRIRSITIRSKRYRTAAGIKLGSARHDFERAFPRESVRALAKAKKAGPKTFQVKKATFTVKGAVTAIKLGR
jgi:hypothetical protein